MSSFADRLIAWQKQYGRQDLPWQRQGAYQVWVSEVMLQQTQVTTVIPYYVRFMDAFPTVQALAAASLDDVLSHWGGLGYYARGRNLHRAAQLIVAQHQGQFPSDFDAIEALPGVGRSTAAAICALAYHQPKAILDGNVKRVLARYLAIDGVTSDKAVVAQLWQCAESLLPQDQVAIYIQAQMDLGATICTRSKPRCDICPVHADCQALLGKRVDALPSRKPKKEIPERFCVLLVCCQQDRIYLQARPPVGIWGGLWSLPQIDLDASMSQEQIAQYLMSQGWGRALTYIAPMSHRFTHFKLNIQPVLVVGNVAGVVAETLDCRWVVLASALKLGLPAPVRTILERLSATIA